MEDLLYGLNVHQAEAVTATEGYVRVIAGAGSGKTRALSRRFAYLVNEMGILPGNILCVTFTNKSANEMKQRIHALTGDRDTGYINTFHGFCVSILKEDSNAVQYPKSFLVLDNSDINEMLKVIYEARGLTLRNMTFAKARDMIEIRKMVKEPEYYLDIINLSIAALKEKYDKAQTPSDIIFYGYMYEAKKCFGLDYNDLIKFSLYIFEKNEDIKLKWQKRLEYIMIDEFQDIDEPQYKLMEVLSGYHKNLFIVGDPDQTIYTWRGADVRYLLDFDKNFTGVKTIMMMENYRSSPQILSAANSLIDKNRHRIKKSLIPTRPDMSPVICHHAQNANEEAKWICKKIKELKENGTPFKDVTVMYRAHYITRVIEECFLQSKIPYTIYSGVQFFDRAEIKDALSYLRMIALRDDLSFMRIANNPKRNLGKRRMDFLKEYADRNHCTLYEALTINSDNSIFKGTGASGFIKLIESFTESCGEMSVSELLSAVLDASGYEKMLRTMGSQERLDNLAELKQSVYEYEFSCGEESTLESYLAHAALFSRADADTNSGDKVRFMTVHTAKGLEFPHVFLCAMNEGIFPSKKTNSLAAMEEERRLAFVAMTRAKDALYISEAEGQNFDGSFRYPSRFIFDIDKELLQYTQEPPSSLITSAKQQIILSSKYLTDDEKSYFSVGQRVFHKIFGEGTVLETHEKDGAYVIKFDELETSRQISFRAKLDKI